MLVLAVGGVGVGVGVGVGIGVGDGFLLLLLLVVVMVVANGGRHFPISGVVGLIWLEMEEQIEGG